VESHNKEVFVATIQIEPKTFFYQNDLSIKVSEVRPNSLFSISFETTDANGIDFHSEAVFKSDRSGCIDLSTDRPTKGYEGVQPNGLLQQLKCNGHAPLSVGSHVEPLVVKVYLRDREHIKEIEGLLAESQFVLSFHKPGVRKEDITDPFPGTFYMPKRADSGLGMICLGGGSGRPAYLNAAMLASHGYPAIALSYFSGKGQPSHCVDIAVEQIKIARDWLMSQDGIDSVGIMGCSKGAELALLAAGYNDFNPIVLVSPTAYVFQGLGDYRHVKSSWTYQEKPLHFLPLPMTALKTAAFVARLLLHRPHRFVGLYEQAIADAASADLKKAAIPLDKIKGSVCICSGGLDGVWPSAMMGKTLEKGLSGAQHVEHHLFEDAGHLVNTVLPKLPVQITSGKGMLLDFGGDLISNTQANIDMWQNIIDFLNKSDSK
jgi:dienelactone hydrolase